MVHSTFSLSHGLGSCTTSLLLLSLCLTPTTSLSCLPDLSANYDCGWYSLVGGVSNSVSGDYSTISGGEYNTIAADADDSVISGGRYNHITASSSDGVIGGGDNNTLVGIVGTVGGGLVLAITSIE